MFVSLWQLGPALSTMKKCNSLEQPALSKLPLESLVVITMGTNVSDDKVKFLNHTARCLKCITLLGLTATQTHLPSL